MWPSIGAKGGSQPQRLEEIMPSQSPEWGPPCRPLDFGPLASRTGRQISVVLGRKVDFILSQQLQETEPPATEKVARDSGPMLPLTLGWSVGLREHTVGEAVDKSHAPLGSGPQGASWLPHNPPALPAAGGSLLDKKTWKAPGRREAPWGDLSTGLRRGMSAR